MGFAFHAETLDGTAAGPDPAGPLHPFDLREVLRQMLAVLEDERQALAGLDVDGIVGSAVRKGVLCGRLDKTTADDVTDECRGLVDAARRLNETNRKVRNLIAANVATRLDALTGQPALYRAQTDAARVRRLR
ncbi:flagellar protein FlgN [Novosphingobium sp.]|uniref:flagellar protein FlgN n=1 Tax=Novosphingobium sp. TaxID=1874826 RepID=UPI003B51C949